MPMQILRVMAAILAFLAWPLQAQNFPSHPLKIVVPNAAGGAADITARTVGRIVKDAITSIGGAP